MEHTEQGGAQFDPSKIITQGLKYLRHLRLMVLMMALGMVLGVTYFLFATPLYQAKSLIYFDTFGTALKNRDVPETAEIYRPHFMRGMMSQFVTSRIQVGAGKRMGFLGENDTFEDLLDQVSYVGAEIVDHRHLELTVMARNPEIVRGFGKAMAEEFQAFQREGWDEFRDEALRVYAEQLDSIDEKVSETVESLSEVERDQRLTEVTIEQQSLLEIPKKLIESKERLVRMADIQQSLGGLIIPTQSGGGVTSSNEQEEVEVDQALSVLSLLSSFNEEATVEIGDVVRRALSGTRDAVTANNSQIAKIVQPDDVEGVESWKELEIDRRLLEKEIQEASDIYLPEHPQMLEMRRRMSSINSSLISEMEVELEKFELEFQRLEGRIGELELRMPEYYAVTEKMGKSAVAYNSVEQTQLMWSKAREALADKLAAVSFSDNFDWIQVRFKGHTSLRDEVPVSPNKKKLILLSLMIGLGGAIGLPSVINLLNTSASNLQQLEAYIGIRGIGIVPLSAPEDLEAVHRSPAQGATVPNYLLECFRLVRSAVCLHPGRTGRSQVVLVTSARPQEGKTTQSANLAWAFHSMGEKVLLVDCDLRRGRIHGLLGIDAGPGMTKMLLGEVSPQDAVVGTGLDGFSVVPRGPVIAGTTELLCQKPFEKLLEYWRTHYDRIILDCPPTLGLSEPSSLQRLADGVVLVVRSEVTPMKDVKDAVTLLRKTGAHFFGFVLNGVDLSKAGNYYHYYYYSAPYYDQLEENEDGLDANDSPVKTEQNDRDLLLS
ncbi:MAG: polysaccharide biosynthesis tyrosine autokinase [Verrucomicrobiales bacterium]|nr:polysaccharide biosynthesis tyrosine autokinase [Verrucomicrobiales bacterium]